MKIIIAILAALCAVSLAGCATTGAAPPPVEVLVPVATACAADPGRRRSTRIPTRPCGGRRMCSKG